MAAEKITFKGAVHQAVKRVGMEPIRHDHLSLAELRPDHARHLLQIAVYPGLEQ
jgi:hypothetical protein